MFDATKLLKINDMCNFCIIIIFKFRKFLTCQF